MNKYFLMLLVVIIALILFNYIIEKFGYVLGNRIEPETFTNQIDYLPQPGNYMKNPTYKQHKNITKNESLNEYDNGVLNKDDVNYSNLFTLNQEMNNLEFNKNILSNIRNELLDKELLTLSNSELKYNILNFLASNQKLGSNTLATENNINALDLLNNLTYLKNEDINKIPAILELFTWAKQIIITLINKEIINRDISSEYHPFKIFKVLDSHHFKIEYISIIRDDKSLEPFETISNNNNVNNSNKNSSNNSKVIKTVDDLIKELRMTDEEMRKENLKQAKLFIPDKENLNPNQYPQDSVIFHQGDRLFGDYQTEDTEPLEYNPNMPFTDNKINSGASIEDEYDEKKQSFKDNSYIKLRIYFTIKLFRKYSATFFTVQSYFDINIGSSVAGDKLLEYNLEENKLKLNNLSNYKISFVLKRLVLVGGGASNTLNKNINNDGINYDIKGITLNEFETVKSAPYKQATNIENIDEIKFKAKLKYNNFVEEDKLFQIDSNSNKSNILNLNNYREVSNVNEYGNDLEFKKYLERRKIHFPYDKTKTDILYRKYKELLKQKQLELANQGITDEKTIQDEFDLLIMGQYDLNTFGGYKCYNIDASGNVFENESLTTELSCKSFDKSTGRVGIWDKPCETDEDCPFYKSNKNYSNEFGKCNKVDGKCEMPVGITPISFREYDKNSEAKCYNCPDGFPDNKCCDVQQKMIDMGESKLTTPDYIFLGDNELRLSSGL